MAAAMESADPVSTRKRRSDGLSGREDFGAGELYRTLLAAVNWIDVDAAVHMQDTGR